MDLTILLNFAKMCLKGTDCKAEIPKTTRKTYSANFKMAVALEVAKEQETLLGVAAKHGVSPSLAAAWKYELFAGTDSIFTRTKEQCASKE